ncbi:MAG: dihydroorotase [Bacteroidales bacterium]|nr:dihydroorotase [Bacteroidales bacterium]
MMSYFLKNGLVINENQKLPLNILVEDGVIRKIVSPKEAIELPLNCKEIDLSGKWILPGVIDDQVHFRDPGLTEKADLYTESQAAIAGGVTSFMDMPNTIPNVLTQEILEDKYQLGAEKSLANFSFYMGTSNDNADEVLKTNPKNVCGVKIFLGASTGNMLVDNINTLEKIFANTSSLVAVHCEDEPTIQANLASFRKKYNDEIPMDAHPLIRSHEACYLSSSFAVGLAKKHGTRLHVLHLSTAKETNLFTNNIPIEEKKITAEVCVHHLWFSDEDYAEKGSFIKWNPAIKTKNDAQELLAALLDEKIDVIATDHAPHQLADKKKDYLHAPSGGPLVQHSLVTMLEMADQGKISVEKVVEKMCHNPARLFQIEKRGYIRQGYFADLVVVNPESPWKVQSENIRYKCAWSPLEGQEFKHQVEKTFVNGNLVFDQGNFDLSNRGKRLLFNR